MWFVPGDEFGDAFHGKWAGDRFEVPAKYMLETRLKEIGSAWPDVSEEAVQSY